MGDRSPKDKQKKQKQDQVTKTKPPVSAPPTTQGKGAPPGK